MISDDHRERFRAALTGDDPKDALVRLARALKAQGISKPDIMALFSEFQKATAGADPKYDLIVDTMDLIEGGPWAKGRDLFPTG